MLHRKRILIVEDEPLIAFDLEQVVKQYGGLVVGPAYTLAPALDFAGTQALDGAILDVQLQGKLATPIIACLSRRGIPCVIHTGRHDPSLTSEWPDIPVINKPALPEHVITLLKVQMDKAAQS